MTSKIDEALVRARAKNRVNEVVRRLKVEGKSSVGIEDDEDTFQLFLALERAVGAGDVSTGTHLHPPEQAHGPD